MKILNKLKIVVWNIGFIDKSIECVMHKESDYNITWMNHQYQDRFFADPFVLAVDEKYIIILAEEYLFLEGKGRIVKLTVDKKTKKLYKNERLIDTDYHLSYPFIYGNKIIPEQNKANKWVSYDLEGRQVGVIANMGLIDATIFDDGLVKWVFATQIEKEKNDALRKVYRYKMVNDVVDESTKMLIKDCYCASRPGGNFFKFEGCWYRPAQTSTEDVYGESIAICKVIANSDTEYKEEQVMIIDSHKQNRFNLGLHTFNSVEDLIIVDGFEMQFHPIYKILYKISHR